MFVILMPFYRRGYCLKYFQNDFACGLIWLRKITTDPDFLAHVEIGCSDDTYSKLKNYISELILDSYECMPVAYVTMHYMI
jgi:hypothetical protein